MSASQAVSGATLHQKVVVTGVRDIWRARGARAYKGGKGQSPWSGSGGRSPLKLKSFSKTTSKSVHKFSTFTTYMQGLESYFADKKTSVTRLFGVRGKR